MSCGLDHSIDPLYERVRQIEAELKVDRSGENNGNVKLTWKAVAEIRRAYRRPGVTMRGLAERYGVGVATIHSVIHNRTWSQ